MYFHTTFYSSCANVCTRRVPFYQFLHSSILAFSASRLRALLRFQDPTASGSTIRPRITTNRFSSHSTQTRHGTLHQSLRAVRNRFIMNPKTTFQEQSSFVTTSSNSSSSPSPIDFASAHPNTRIRIPTSTPTLIMSRKKKPPPSNTQTKHKLVRAFGYTSEGHGVLMIYLTMVDEAGTTR